MRLYVPICSWLLVATLALSACDDDKTPPKIYNTAKYIVLGYESTEASYRYKLSSFDPNNQEFVTGTYTAWDNQIIDEVLDQGYLYLLRETSLDIVNTSDLELESSLALDNAYHRILVGSEKLFLLDSSNATLTIKTFSKSDLSEIATGIIADVTSFRDVILTGDQVWVGDQNLKLINTETFGTTKTITLPADVEFLLGFGPEMIVIHENAISVIHEDGEISTAQSDMNVTIHPVPDIGNGKVYILDETNEYQSFDVLEFDVKTGTFTPIRRPLGSIPLSIAYDASNELLLIPFAPRAILSPPQICPRIGYEWRRTFWFLYTQFN